jgi:hypothetical protein
MNGCGTGDTVDYSDGTLCNFCLSVLLSIAASYVVAWCHEEVLARLAVNFGAIALTQLSEDASQSW